MATIDSMGSNRFRASFEDPDLLLAAVKRLKADGHPVQDTYTPFPVHGMDEALGQKPSRLPRACLAFALLGLGIALAVQIWTSAYDYPVIVGGKPAAGIPAFIPISFELTVLLAGLGVVASLFVVARLRPRFRFPNLHPGVSDHRFVVAGQVRAGSSFQEVRATMEQMGAVETALLVEDQFHRPRSLWQEEARPVVFILAFAPAVLLLLALPLLNRDYRLRNRVWDGGMMEAIAAQSFDANSALPGGQVLQAPPAGTLSRKGAAPLAYGSGKAEAERAGRELANPMSATLENFNRGRKVYERSCAACHGRDGDNNSSVIVGRGLLAPTILVSPPVQAMADGQIFHIATFGGPRSMKGLGDLISREDRWRVVLYLRELQKGAAPKPTPNAASPGASARSTGAKP